MKKIFRQDSFILGIVMGAIAPWLLFVVLYFINKFAGNLFHPGRIILTTSTLQLTAIVVNVFMMRHYLVKLKFDKTGRGILILTFVYVLAYFVNDYLLK